MISEGSCDTDDRVMAAKIQLCHHRIFFFFKYIKIENGFKL